MNSIKYIQLPQDHPRYSELCSGMFAWLVVKQGNVVEGYIKVGVKGGDIRENVVPQEYLDSEEARLVLPVDDYIERLEGFFHTTLGNRCAKFINELKGTDEHQLIEG